MLSAPHQSGYFPVVVVTEGGTLYGQVQVPELAG